MADGRPAAGARYMVVATLARFRVALGFVFGVLVLILARPNRESLTIGMSIAACGEAIRVWAAGHLRKSREVTVSGPYRWVAHPLYVGSAVMGVGAGDCVGERPGGGADCHLPRRDAHGGHQERRSVSAADVRRPVRPVPERRGSEAPRAQRRIAAQVQSGAGDGQPRVSGGCRPWRGHIAADLEGNV